MTFGSIEYFWLFLLTPLLVVFFIWSLKKRKKALEIFAELPLMQKLAPSLNNDLLILKFTLFILFFIFMVLALVRPQFGVKMKMVERQGIDIMVALDISKSMLAEDVVPNRIDRAKFEIGKFYQLLRGDRIGLIVFAGESFVQCPLTLDYGAAQMFLDAVETDWIETQGTSMAEAIRQAEKAFETETGKHKILILISDGEDHEGEALDVAKKAAEKGMIIHTVGIGSESGAGAPIPIAKANGNVTYKKDKKGNIVMTKLNSEILKSLAAAGNGIFSYSEGSLDLSKVYGAISELEKKDLGKNKVAIYEEKYQYALLVALFFILIEFFIPERRKRKTEWKGRI